MGAATGGVWGPERAEASPLRLHERRNYGALVPDPAGLIDLPQGFRYRVLSREGQTMRDGRLVPSAHDGMAAFFAGFFGTWLVRNHEISPADVHDKGRYPVEHVHGAVYDPEVEAGGTTTLLVDHGRRVLREGASLSGTIDNCAGGPTPWGTWLSCEETESWAGKPHGYVFEVDPLRGGDARPLTAMGRFKHEAVAFDFCGRAYLTEDASGPHGCFYRFSPFHPLSGRGSLHGGGTLEAMVVPATEGADLSVIDRVGQVLEVDWVEVPNPDPRRGDAPVREQAIVRGATSIQKCEGTWRADDGSVWFVASRADGPNASEPQDVTAKRHVGQIYRYDPLKRTLELVVHFSPGAPFDQPDNLTFGPHGFAVACTDGDDDQWLFGVDEDARVFPLARNALNGREFAGATFSPDGRTLFVNMQGPPGLTLAIWGPF